MLGVERHVLSPSPGPSTLQTSSKPHSLAPSSPTGSTRLPVHQSVHKPALPPFVPRIPPGIARVHLSVVKVLRLRRRRAGIPAAHAVRRPKTLAVLARQERVEPGEFGGAEGVDGESAKGGEDPLVRGAAHVAKGGGPAVELLLRHERHAVPQQGPRRADIILGEAGIGAKIRFGVWE